MLVTPGSVAELSAAMQLLASSPALRARLSEAASVAASAFSEERVVHGVTQIYDKVLSAGRKGG